MFLIEQSLKMTIDEAISHALEVAGEHNEVNKSDGNCLDCEFQYLEDSDYWCSVCPSNPEDI